MASGTSLSNPRHPPAPRTGTALSAASLETRGSDASLEGEEGGFAVGVRFSRSCSPRQKGCNASHEAHGGTTWSPDCPSGLLSALGAGPPDIGSGGGFLVLTISCFSWSISD